MQELHGDVSGVNPPRGHDGEAGDSVGDGGYSAKGHGADLK